MVATDHPGRISGAGGRAETGVWAERLFRSIDGRDVDTFSAFLAPDVEFRFGNAEPVRGRSSTTEVVQGFLDGLAGIEHRLADVWDTGEAVMCHGDVTYTRPDAYTLTVPFANVFYLRDDLVERYLIFADVSGLFARG